MIDESPADEVVKQGQRGKLDALLALAEATDCRRVRLLGYFGEDITARPAAGPSQGGASPLGGTERSGVGAYRCWNCDNCLNPPQTWDGTEAARKLLSCIYRFHQRGERFGAGHLIDVLRGKATDKTRQYGHDSLSTWGCGAELSEQQWRAVLRQLVALGHVAAEGEFNTLALQDSARAVLKGEVELRLREAEEKKPRGKASRTGARPKAGPALGLDAEAQQRFEALKAWRSEVAREHGLPAYVIFQNTTLAEMARVVPGDLAELGEISGVGAKKLEAYGREILRVLGRD
jgi:ATP-dependent DNA helicase RecQ